MKRYGGLTTVHRVAQDLEKTASGNELEMEVIQRDEIVRFLAITVIKPDNVLG